MPEDTGMGNSWDVRYLFLRDEDPECHFASVGKMVIWEDMLSDYRSNAVCSNYKVKGACSG